jgi:hypothetical protein
MDRDRILPPDARITVLARMVRLVLYERPNGCVSEPGNTVTYDVTANAAFFGACAVSGPALQWKLEPSAVATTDDGDELSLSEELELPEGPLIMRCDRIDFPPGGIAYTHTHPGPGIRRLVAGTIDIRTHGELTSYVVGGAWFESGPDPVHATASTYEPSAFVRVLVLPAEWAGKRTITYVDPADEEKPKLQTPTVYFDQRAVAATQSRIDGGLQLLWGIASLDEQVRFIEFKTRLSLSIFPCVFCPEPVSTNLSDSHNMKTQNAAVVSRRTMHRTMSSCVACSACAPPACSRLIQV